MKDGQVKYMAHKNSGKKVAIAAIVIVAALVALYGITPYAITTKISNIKPNTTVYIYGTVEKRLAFGQFSGFNMSDGTGSVYVIWNGTLPASGERVIVHGEVKSLFLSNNEFVQASSVNQWYF